LVLDCRSDGRGLCRARRFRSGRGVIYLFAAKTNDERRQVLRAIARLGWQRSLAARCRRHTLLCFPAALCSSFSGFYLPLTIVLWLLILRGIGIEFRAHIENGCGRISSMSFQRIELLLAVFSERHWATWCGECHWIPPAISLNRSGRISNSVRDRHPRLVYRTHRRAGAGDLDRAWLVLRPLKTDADLGRRAAVRLVVLALQFFLTVISLVATYFIRPTL